MTRHALLAVAVLAFAAGCRARVDRCSDPVAVARSFIEAMEAHDAEAALPFLSKASRERLEAAAAEATKQFGHEVGPAAMLIPERSVLARPEWLVLSSTTPDEALVEVSPPADAVVEEGLAGSVQRLVREEGCWKIALFESAPTPPIAPQRPAEDDAGPSAQ